MSDIYRSAIQARISRLPPSIPHYPDQSDDEQAEAADSLGSLPSQSRSSAFRATRRAPNPSFSPLSASAFFDQASQVEVPASGLDVRVWYTPPRFADGSVIVCIHGAGYSGLSFACFAREVTERSKGECGVLSMDLRGHGRTTRLDGRGPEAEDLSIETLVSDLVNLIKVVFPDARAAPALLLIGHSLGGPICVDACPFLQAANYKVTGVAALDIVEEFTLEALPLMHSLLNARREGFDSQEDAIEWHVRTNVIRNPDSARVSIPGTIVPGPADSPWAYIWRTPLRLTAPYWTNWFTGLSSKFLSARAARLLVLAGTERLDRALMIGQMQGKFQLEVMQGVGHMLHEDDPTHLAEVIVEFWRRNERVVQGIKKVGEQ
ncbi:Alpha/Beta hydrolase protein [Amylocystis lapponica]|nr:Alpha/Beta hydrolase protein [Amylocystis lapponica]